MHTRRRCTGPQLTGCTTHQLSCQTVLVCTPNGSSTSPTIAASRPQMAPQPRCPMHYPPPRASPSLKATLTSAHRCCQLHARLRCIPFVPAAHPARCIGIPSLIYGWTPLTGGNHRIPLQPVGTQRARQVCNTSGTTRAIPTYFLLLISIFRIYLMFQPFLRNGTSTKNLDIMVSRFLFEDV